MLGTVVEKQLSKTPAAAFKIDADGRGSTSAEDLFRRVTHSSLGVSLPSTLRSPRGTGLMDETVFGPCQGEGQQGRSLPILGLPGATVETESSLASPSGTDISFHCLPETVDSGRFCGQPSPMANHAEVAAQVDCCSEMGIEEESSHTCQEQGDVELRGGKHLPCSTPVPNLPIRDSMERETCQGSGSATDVFFGISELDESHGLSVEESLMQQTFVKLTPRFTLSDIAQNPELAKAAKLELDGKHARSGETDNVSSCDAQSRVTEIENIRFATDTADRDAQRELQVGMEEVDVLLKRLLMGRRSVEQLLKFVQKLHQANVAYSRALLQAARSAVSSISNSDNWKCASEGISELPMIVGGAHSQISQNLAESSVKLQAVLKSMKALSDDLCASWTKIQTEVIEKRNTVSKALGAHERACHSYGASLERGSSTGSWSADKTGDPWLTEGHLTAGHSELLEAQFGVRNFLAESFKRCKEEETNRLSVTKQVVDAIVKCHTASFEERVKPFTNELSRVVSSLDPEKDVMDLVASANAHEDFALALGTQKKEESSLRCGDLYCSPDIIRQGDLELWDSDVDRWVKGHFVLTQAGFLYGMLGKDKVGPIPSCTLCLARCSFDEGEAPVFSITEGGAGWMRGRRRIITLRAPSVVECCEWAIAVRDAIASLRNKR